MSSIKVSVIVPTYNVELYLSRCLNSLINQSLKGIEIIVIDDGSTDNTSKILDDYVQFDSRIKIIKQPNQKQGAARNRGLEIAQGEFVGFVDADDWVDLDYFEKMYKAAIENNVNMAAATMTRDKENKVRNHLSLGESKTYFGVNEIVKAIDRHLETAGKIYKRSLIGDLRFMEGVYYEDAPYTIRALSMVKSLVTVPDTTYHYFSNQYSTIKQQSLKGKNREDKIFTNLDLINYCEKNGIDIGNWEILKERHFLWTIKHYKNSKDFYFLGVKVFTLTIPFNEN